jgi:hypothetical protein
MRKIIIILVVVVFIPLIFYWGYFGIQFSNASFSSWKDFSGFFSLYISFAGVIVSGLLTIEVMKLTKSENQKKLIAERPIITFRKISYGDKGSSDDYYKIENVGRGAALNIRLYKRATNQVDKNFQNPIQLYSLGINGDIDRPEHTKLSNLLAVIYEDVSRDPHLSLMYGDTHVFYSPLSDLKRHEDKLEPEYKWVVDHFLNLIK